MAGARPSSRGATTVPRAAAAGEQTPTEVTERRERAVARYRPPLPRRPPPRRPCDHHRPEVVVRRAAGQPSPVSSRPTAARSARGPPIQAMPGGQYQTSKSMTLEMRSADESGAAEGHTDRPGRRPSRMVRHESGPAWRRAIAAASGRTCRGRLRAPSRCRRARAGPPRSESRRRVVPTATRPGRWRWASVGWASGPPGRRASAEGRCLGGVGRIAVGVGESGGIVENGGIVETGGTGGCWAAGSMATGSAVQPEGLPLSAPDHRAPR